MVGVEIDFVVKDSLQALDLYEKIFDTVERVEVTNLKKGENEVVFNLYGTRFHMLDETQDFGLIAPSEENPINSFWFNVTMPDIKKTYAKAMEFGCKEIQPVTEMADFGVSNAIFRDPFGYVWMLHQIHKVVSPEERVKIWEEKKNQ